MMPYGSLRTGRALVCVALLQACPPPAQAQTVRWDAAIGGFSGDRPTYNGPTFQVRASATQHPNRWMALRATYRDDDESSGRARSVGLLGEVLFVLRGRSKAVYVPLGVGLEWMSVTATGSLPPGDAQSGAYFAADVGVGLELNGGSRRIIVESRQSFRRFGNSTSLVVGVRSYASRGQGDGGSFDLAALATDPTTNAYVKDSRYQGYVVGYRHSLHSAFPSDLRAMMGIEFLRFTAKGGSWSTGAITVAGGTGLSLFADTDQRVQVSLVAHAGLVIFAEPASAGPSPRIGVGPEFRWTPGPLGVVVASEAVLSGGPAGAFTAVATRVGLTLGL